MASSALVRLSRTQPLRLNLDLDLVSVLVVRWRRVRVVLPPCLVEYSPLRLVRHSAVRSGWHIPLRSVRLGSVRMYSVRSTLRTVELQGPQRKQPLQK